MRRFVTSMVMVIVLAYPFFSFAENNRGAYTSYYVISPSINPGLSSEHLRTDITVSNISNTVQNVTVTLYNYNGTPLVNQPYMYRASDDGNGQITFAIANTNQNGQFSFTLQPFATGGASMIGTGVNHDGFGKITATSAGDGNGQVVAHAFITDTDNTSGAIYQNSITINGGNPF